jgi:hypothetical protein
MNLLNDGLASSPSPSSSSTSFLSSSSLSSNSSYSITLREKLKQRANHFREVLRELRKEDVIYFLLFFVMGTSSWMLVNGVYLQIPFFIADLPEKESIGAWISIVIQLSNSVALFLLLFNYFFRPLPYVPTIGLNILLGVLTSILLSFFWDVKTKIDDEEHSIVLLILTFLAAVVGSVAVTFYYPFTSLYHSSMISAVATGMGW